MSKEKKVILIIQWIINFIAISTIILLGIFRSFSFFPLVLIMLLTSIISTTLLIKIKDNKDTEN